MFSGDGNWTHGKNRLPSFHNSIEFAFGLEGNLEILVDGASHTLGAGEICFLNSLEPHSYRYQPGVKCYIVLISAGFFTDVNQLGSISFPTHMEKSEHFEVIKSFLDYALKTWDPDSLLCKHAFADMLAYLMTRYYPVIPKKEIEKQSAVLLNAVKYICEHYRERLTVESVAAHFGYSPNYFSSAFNRFMGTSFPDYLNTCRLIEYYRIRRMEPSLPTSTIVERCGFGSMNTFYRALCKLEGEGQREEEK